MRIRILGCSGGIGGRHLRTTSMLVDQDILIDAGTGVGDLSIAELVRIDHVFVTHTHLDHIACLPLIADTVGDMRDRPLTVYGTEEILAILRTHVFNWCVWPDFTEIPSPEAPFVRFQQIQAGEAVRLGERSITAVEVNHTVPAVGYVLDSGRASLIFSGDTTVCPGFWASVNDAPNLRYLIVECAFPNREFELATASKHLCPSMLAQELTRLRREVELFITHLKPGQIELTMLEIEDGIGEYRPRMLQNNQVFEL
ncbi:3',5'-cyclic-nucleotide phosphodiesterase [Denitratisoma sp. DHT3]|uniref:3',5'-cyclic-nucleotide phosphodiesterase n=1 Tax=Denitratisoma sp. DHT3 TaxID=1981880 RepID=UPI0011986CB2|nr:3',5'-cyclic-nucleotide phosphodiesterase [Denitratisoma sp. DHT3]QDX80054.1 3',5'-cyclic-nucleotide phosphodiesterase [Denitratisoma sp. DHT3]